MGRGKLKKFKFALQSLLDLRAKKLEEKQIEFGKLQFIMRSLQTELLNLEDELLCSKNSLAHLISNNNNIEVGMISVNQRYIAKIDDDILNQQKKIEEHKVVLENKQKEMLLHSIKTHNERYLKARNGREKQIVIWDMIDNLKIYSVFLKHPAFCEEHEFRMVIGIRTHSHDSICEFEVQNGI